jgi:hypothetical protein
VTSLALPVPEHILCAAVYVDTGKAEPPRRSYAYPATGLVFAGWRHGDCLMLLEAWASRLTNAERAEINAVADGQLAGRNQGFLTSRGRYIDRHAAWEIAEVAGQVKPGEPRHDLFSEDLY